MAVYEQLANTSSVLHETADVGGHEQLIASSGIKRVSLRTQLNQYLRWNIRFAVAFALLEVMAFMLYEDYPSGITATIITFYTIALFLAQSWARLGRSKPAVTLVCGGLLISVLVISVIQPGLYPTLAVVPLLAVVLALPYYEGRHLYVMLGVCWLVSVLIVIASSIAASWVDSSLPIWFATSWLSVSLAAAVGLVLLLLWQFSSRLTESLASIRAAEERYSLAVQGANDGLWDWDLAANTVYYAPRWARMLNLHPSQVGTSPNEWFDRIHPEDLDRVNAEVAIHLDGLTPHFESEYRLRDQQGRYRWMLCRGIAVRDETNKATRMAGSQTDITRRKQVEEQLVHDAYHDALTQLPNRMLFADRLGRLLARVQRHPNYLCAVLYMDLDRFKNINDSLGHHAGDRLLVELSQRFQQCLRPNDTLARLSGDEFAVLLDSISDRSVVTQIVQRIHNQLEQPFILEGQEVFAAVSIGVALSMANYKRPEEMLRDADIALYRAKALGRSRHVVFDPAMHEHAVARLKTEMDLRRAIERQEFVVYYQPIVDLCSGMISGFEALVRWQHPQRGVLPPSEFLSVAEETGLIAPIGWQVLHESCRQMRIWDAHLPAHRHLTVSVNLSATQFMHPDLQRQIERTFREIATDARRLSIEITENVMIENAESVKETLALFRQYGIQTHIDDFGTGYSSLSALQHLPIEGLKIDGSFVRRLGVAGEQGEMLRTLVTLAHNLNLKVVAEGIETPEQLAFLRSIGCDYGQGYLFSVPIEGKSAQALVAANTKW